MIRWLGPIIIAFWIVMTLLLARMTWFPGESGLVEVPPARVLELFVNQKSVATELHLFDRRHQRIGTVHIATRTNDQADRPDFEVTVNGRIGDPSSPGDERPRVTWNAAARMVDGERLEEGRLHLRVPESGVEVKASLVDGTPLAYQVVQNGRVLIDSERPDEGMSGPGPLARGMPFGPGGFSVGQDDASRLPLEVEAYEVMVDYGGRARPGYRLTAALMDRHRGVVEFSSAGELLRVVTEDGYLLINPLYFTVDDLSRAASVPASEP